MRTQAGYTKTMAHTGAVTLIQRFGSAINRNVHFHMLFLDGAYEGHRVRVSRHKKKYRKTLKWLHRATSVL